VIVDSPPIQATTQIAQLDTQLETPTPAVPSKKPVIVKAQVKPAIQAATDKKQLIQLVKNWAKAWSEQQFEQYVSAYSASYRGQYPNHKEWLKQRRKRIIRADKIKVSLSNFKVTSNDPNIAVIDFHQAYQSSTYRDKVVKRIQLDKIDNDWKISREVTLVVL
jgi:murein L,D-transpeptidase YafK